MMVIQSPRKTLFSGSVFLVLLLGCVTIGNENVRAQFEGPHALVHRHPLAADVRWGVLETDFWIKKRHHADYQEVTEFPPPHGFFRDNHLSLLQGAHFSPLTYLLKIQEWSLHPGGSDVLFYYGGIHKAGVERHGLNFNSWNTAELASLHKAGGRPFIGLETMDPIAIDSMLTQLKAAGFGKGDRLYVRIAAEPSGMSYGIPAGTRRHTAACYSAYQKNFAKVAAQLRQWGRRQDVRLRVVFAGDSAEDFDHYVPAAKDYDAIGYDLYVTPANSHKVLPLLQRVSDHFENKPMVIPELGIATGGQSKLPIQWAVSATPEWGNAALSEVLLILGRHQAGVAQVTVFSVNVAARMKARTWDWAWTTEMYDRLTEWRENPSGWRKGGFHRYDPATYPIGKNVLLDNRPGLKIYYRRLSNEDAAGHPLYLESGNYLEGDAWRHLERAVIFNHHEIENPDFQPV